MIQQYKETLGDDHVDDISGMQLHKVWVYRFINIC